MSVTYKPKNVFLALNYRSVVVFLMQSFLSAVILIIVIHLKSKKKQKKP